MKICAVDIDGVLADYPKNWINWINNNTDYKVDNLIDAKDTIPFSRYTELKYQFRTTGQELEASPIEGASEFMMELDKRGYCVTLLTARPLFEIKQVLYDTIVWLKKYDMPHDLLFQGKDKHIKLMKHFKEIDFMVEDNCKIANSVAEAGFKVYLVNNQYNAEQESHLNVTRVNKLEEILRDIK